MVGGQDRLGRNSKVDGYDPVQADPGEHGLERADLGRRRARGSEHDERALHELGDDALAGAGSHEGEAAAKPRREAGDERQHGPGGGEARPRQAHGPVVLEPDEAGPRGEPAREHPSAPAAARHFGAAAVIAALTAGAPLAWAGPVRHVPVAEAEAGGAPPAPI